MSINRTVPVTDVYEFTAILGQCALPLPSFSILSSPLDFGSNRADRRNIFHISSFQFEPQIESGECRTVLPPPRLSSSSHFTTIEYLFFFFFSCFVLSLFLLPWFLSAYPRPPALLTPLCFPPSPNNKKRINDCSIDIMKVSLFEILAWSCLFLQSLSLLHLRSSHHSPSQRWLLLRCQRKS